MTTPRDGALERAPRDAALDRDAAWLDVRPPEERYGDVGYLPGSVPVDLARLDAEPGAIVRELGSRPVLAICLSGRRSADVVASLVRAGHAASYNLRGGVLAWGAAGLPLCGVRTPEPDEVPAVDGPASLPRALVSCFLAEQVELALDRGGAPFDPTAQVDALLRPALATRPLDAFAIYEAIDQLAAIALRRGHALERIARNVDAMRAAADRAIASE